MIKNNIAVYLKDGTTKQKLMLIAEHSRWKRSFCKKKNNKTPARVKADRNKIPGQSKTKEDIANEQSIPDDDFIEKSKKMLEILNPSKTLEKAP